MAIAKDKKRDEFYITYKEKQADGSFKTRNIRNREWKIDVVTKKYMKNIELSQIDEDKRRRSISPTHSRKSGKTLSDCVEEFLEYIIPDKDQDTIRNYRLAFKNHLFTLVPKDTPMEKSLSVTIISKYKAGLMNYLYKPGKDSEPKHLSESAKRNSAVALKQLIRYMTFRKYISRDLAFDCLEAFGKMKKTRNNKKGGNYLKNGSVDVKLLLSVMPGDDRVMFETLLWTGARIGEFLGLRVGDCDFFENTITIERQIDCHGKVKYQTKGREMRTICVNPEVMRDLNHYLSKEGLTGFQNASLFGKTSRSAVRRKLDKYLRLANIEHITLHGLRHSYATMLFNAGADIKTVQEILGHASMETTMQFYIHQIKGKNKIDFSKMN